MIYMHGRTIFTAAPRSRLYTPIATEAEQPPPTFTACPTEAFAIDFVLNALYSIKSLCVWILVDISVAIVVHMLLQ